MAYVPADRNGAMREVAQAYELIKSHQPRLQFDGVQELSATTNIAQSLLNEALRALHLALSVMNREPSAAAGAESSARSNMPHLFSRSDASGDVGGTMNQQRKGKMRRSNEETSRVILTDAPHYDDGYIWRKYGEKKINGTQFIRNYFRCSYKYDRGCQATKQIQQQSSNDLPMFQVTYNSEHTCNCTTAANKYIKIDVPQLSYCNTNGTASPMNDAMINQEQGVLPPLVEVSTVFSDSTSCQETFPLSHPYTSSLDHVDNHLTSINGVTDDHCGMVDGYIDLGQMALPQVPLEENPFSGAELDLLCDSLMYK